MPAVTVSDLTALPRVAATSEQRLRPVRQVTTAPRGFEGEGFPVYRAFAGVDLAALDPFIHMDQMGEVEYAAGEPKGTPWHPHRGFETVTYLLDGAFQHQDSAGGGGLIRDGATQWMTAGSGILHIETPPEELVVAGGLFHGVQLWVNLPARQKWAAPRYQNLDGEAAALQASADGGALLRLIAGSVGEARGPGSTHTPVTVAHATIAPGAALTLPWPRGFNALVYVLAGDGSVTAAARPLREGQLAVLGAGDTVTVSAADVQDSRTAAMEVLLLGGRPLREPVEHYGPFVMNTREELVQAFEDFRAGRLGVIPDNALMPHTVPGQRLPGWSAG